MMVLDHLVMRQGELAHDAAVNGYWHKAKQDKCSVFVQQDQHPWAFFTAFQNRVSCRLFPSDVQDQ